MNRTWKMSRRVVVLVILLVTLIAPVDARAQGNPPAGKGQSSLSAEQGLFRNHLADYDSELRRPDGRVDIDGMVARLKELGVTTYYWLIWHAPTDWDDLKLFLPKAAEAGIQVWVYLVPPSESPPSYGGQYSEPFRLDYYRWAEEIARLSLQHPNLTAWVIDDFYANHELFTPAYLRQMQAKAKDVNPRLAFLPLMYFDEIRAKFAEDYREVIDGVVVAYLQDRDEIDWTWAILNDAAVVPPSELSYPWDTPSSAGDFVTASQSAKVPPADRYVLTFRERDDFTGPTAGYHFKQVLVDEAVVWEEDVAGGSPAWRKITVDVTEQARGKTRVTVGFRLLDKKGVSNFGVRWRVNQLGGENLQFAADLAEPGKWQVDRKGAFEAGFGGETKSGQRRFHIPFVSMTAGDQSEFRQRHGDPATPERIAEWLRMSLQAWQDGKCDGVVTYCLDKRPQSQTFPLAQPLFREYRQRASVQNTGESWWLANGLRVVTYEFLERSYRANDLTPEEILESLDRFGGCDLVLLKGFHYWQGRFDDSSGGYPRFRGLAETLIPKLHARGIKAGIFGFTDRDRSYGDGPDHRRIMEVWQEYVRLGADILFVDEESDSGGLDIPSSCLSHCDELRTTFKRPVGLFLYGPASKAGQVREIASHVDVIGEMGYNLFLEARGDYGLEEVTRQWSQALKEATDRPVVYWTGAMVMLDPGQQPGSPFWRERFGERTPARYFEDYLQRARDCGAEGVFFHSLCRFSGLAAQTQTDVAAAMKRVFGQMDKRMGDVQPFVVADQELRISAGILGRVIDLANGNLSTTHLRVSDKELLAGPASELSLTVTRAEPNARPKGLKDGEGGSIDSVRTFQPGQHVDPGKYDDASLGQTTRWVAPVRIQASRWADNFTLAAPQVSAPAPDVSRLTILARARKESVLDGLTVTAVYEVYRGEPVVRKWVEIANESSVWRKIEQLTIDDFALAASISERVPLTPAGYGVQPSLIGFSSADGTFGVIAASEIPSALRTIASTGALGYTSAIFEWVLEPGERFVSEPVFLYAFSGPVEQTISARSTPLDRAVEGPFQRFLSRHIGIAGEPLPCDAPQWLTWANFGPDLNDAMIRRQADLAARAGFVQFLLDDGWQRDRLGTEPDPVKFPDFAATAAYIRSRGLKLGLWLSCFRDKDSPDLKALPDARSLPVVTRLGGIAMSFTTPWREFYARDLARLHERYGAAYFKQDFSNIIYGDLAENHPNRTRKESLLRGLRGLLEAQDRLRALAPEVMNQITHEIYWDTPGVPCDLAALKHAARYHVSPNACGGIVSRRVNASAVDPQKVRAELLAACGQARQIFYSHRGLPLYCLEFYGAATEDHQGSLTADVQDRQIVSWLLGAPLVFSGDLSTLSAEHLAHYQKRFALVNRLHQSWDIYRHFQFSGVPAPNDDDWHWWGKLNDEGYGAVVVVRGGGPDHRTINIPWVKPDRQYAVVALFSDRQLGEFTGRQLQSTGIELTLPRYGQEILELTPARTSRF